MAGDALLPLRHWLVGSGRTTSGLMVSCGGVDPAWATHALWTSVLLPRRSAFPDNGPTSVYDGSFVDVRSDIGWCTGDVLQQLPYGLATGAELRGTTVLRICDLDDFSAFLRDADTAWQHGRFSDTMTDPRVLVADLVALGDVDTPNGPAQRAFMWADGAVSTSPSGRILGLVSDGLPYLESVWRRFNGDGAGCAVSLGRVVGARDRSDALAERPWLGRYLQVCAVLRTRSAPEVAFSVTGFGGQKWSAATDIVVSTLTDEGINSQSVLTRE